MDKQQKLKIALPILVIIMAVVWGPVITGSGPKRKAGKAAKKIGAAPQGENNIDLAALSRAGTREKARTSYAEWGRNPFTLVQDPEALIIEGIVWDRENPKAIINGDILGIGDPVGPNVIADIKQNSVILRGETGDIELRFGAGR